MIKLNEVFSLLLLITVTAFPQNFWQRINSPTTQRLNSIVFTDSLNGWVCGDSGVIIHTSDAGADWDTQFSNDSLNVVKLYFLDNQTGWASAWSTVYEPYGTYFLKTTNGGVNWQRSFLNVGEKFANEFYFLDTSTGFVIGYPNLFMRTTNGGANWRTVNLDSSVLAGFPPYTIKFFSRQYGYACGGVRDIAGVVWRTTDGGVDWTTVVDNLTSEPVYDLNIFDSLNVLVMGGDPEYGASMVRTTDGGDNWQYTLLGVLWYPVNMGFRTPTEGWAPMGAQRKFLFTSDAGYTWNEVDTPDSVNVLKISFTDTAHGFGIGENGEMVRYFNAPVPVELNSFTASVKNNSVLLNWLTSTETNNYGFQVERQTNMKGWDKLGFIEGSGTTTIPHSYSFTDNDILPGNSFYRLTQVNFDGSFKYSKIIGITAGVPSEFSLEQNYPNPFNPSTIIKFAVPQAGNVEIKVYNVLGAEIATLVNEYKEAGKYSVEFSADNLSGQLGSGVYFYTIKAGSFVKTKKMIVLK